MTIPLKKELAEKVLQIVDCGLTKGLGNPEPGEMCVEAAVCKALDEPHSDRPSCVHERVAEYKVRVNDCQWKDEQSRAAGLREIAVYQLGSNLIDGDAFSRKVCERVLREVAAPLLERFVKADHPQAAEVIALCRQLATLDATDQAFLDAVIKLEPMLPLAWMMEVVIFGRDGWSASKLISAHEHLAGLHQKAKHGEWHSAAQYAVCVVDVLARHLDPEVDECGSFGCDDETHFQAMSRIGCDVLRELGSPGAQLWDELQG